MVISYYRSKTTNAIHMVGDFPEPKREDTSQCGQPLGNMKFLAKRLAIRAPDHEFCLKCSQLLGLK